MTKYELYKDELRRIGIIDYDGKQYEEYFKELSTSYVLCRLSGRQMAYIALKMAAQRIQGYLSYAAELKIDR